MSHNRNPGGRNQHAPIPQADDPVLAAALTAYHRDKVTSNQIMSDLFYAQTGIRISAPSIKRRRKELGLHGSRSKSSGYTEKDKEQIVLAQLDRDPARGTGPSTMQTQIAFHQGVHLPRSYISQVMHTHDPDAFQNRAPGAKKIKRFPKVPLGIHERWAGDGHDKLYSIGFPIWAVVDDATGRWLGAWIVPSNRMGHIIGYLFLCLVVEYQGIPMQFTTDCGSETTQLYGLANALRTLFHPDFDNKVLPAHVYLRSVHNISIERSWLRLRVKFGDNACIEYHEGISSGVFHPDDVLHVELSQWLWSMILQRELDDYMAVTNAHPMRTIAEKAGPSGCSRNQAFVLHDKFGLDNLILPLTEAQLVTVSEIKEAMGGDETLQFVSTESAVRFQAALDSLNIANPTMHNAWCIFEALIPLLR